MPPLVTSCQHLWVWSEDGEGPIRRWDEVQETEIQTLSPLVAYSIRKAGKEEGAFCR